MGRREQGASRLEPSSRTWDVVRRTLGRLFTHAAVRDLSSSEMTPAVALRASEALHPPLLVPGAQEKAWWPEGAIRQAAIPQAGVGARDGSLLPTVRLVAENGTPDPPVCRAIPIVHDQAGRIIWADLLLPASVVRLPPEFVSLPSEPVRVESVPLLEPAERAGLGIRTLTGWGMDRPKVSALRLPRVAEPRIRWGGDAVLSRMALSRRGLEAPSNVPFELAFGAEERRLAEAAHLPPADVTLLGIYPGVPILAVSRIVVAEEGRLLRLWLKPEVLRGRNAVRMITLLVGRQTSSGKMLQAAL